MLQNLVRGLADAGRGGSFLLGHPRLWKWLVAPFIAAAVLLGALIWLLFSWIDPWIAELVGMLPEWLSAVGGALEVVLFILLLFVGYAIYVSVASVLAAPFNEMLSEDIEEMLAGASGPPFSVARFVRDVLLGVGHAVRRLAVYVATMAVLFVIGVIVPVLGPLIATVGGAVATARFAAYDAYDAVWARHSWSYRAKMDYLAKHRMRTLGLGAAVALLLLVPVCNLLALSVGAAGATLAHLRQSGQAPTG